MKTRTKLILSGGMLVLALVLSICSGFEYGRRISLSAMLFSFCGNMMMIDFRKEGVNCSRTDFLLAMSLFSCAHLRYAERFLYKTYIIEKSIVSVEGIMFFALLAFLVFLLVLNFREYIRKPDKASIIYAVIYLIFSGFDFVLAYTYGKVCCRYVGLKAIGALAPIGVALFMFASLLTAFREFANGEKRIVDNGRMCSYIIWSLYVVGQTIMIIS